MSASGTVRYPRHGQMLLSSVVKNVGREGGLRNVERVWPHTKSVCFWLMGIPMDVKLGQAQLLRPAYPCLDAAGQLNIRRIGIRRNGRGVEESYLRQEELVQKRWLCTRSRYGPRLVKKGISTVATQPERLHKETNARVSVRKRSRMYCEALAG